MPGGATVKTDKLELNLGMNRTGNRYRLWERHSVLVMLLRGFWHPFGVWLRNPTLIKINICILWLNEEDISSFCFILGTDGHALHLQKRVARHLKWISFHFSRWHRKMTSSHVARK